MVKEVSAGAVVFKIKKGGIEYLLLHYGSKKHPKHWDFSRGGVEKGERWQETARREIREETGIKELKFIHGFIKNIKWFYKRRFTPVKSRFAGTRQRASYFTGQEKGYVVVFKRAIFYLAETKENEVKISSEHIGWSWLDYEKALKQLTFKNAKNILIKANNFLLKDIKYGEKK